MESSKLKLQTLVFVVMKVDINCGIATTVEIFHILASLGFKVDRNRLVITSNCGDDSFFSSEIQYNANEVQEELISCLFRLPLYVAKRIEYKFRSYVSVGITIETTI